MACKCTEIANCNQDIIKLETARGYLIELQGLDLEVETDLRTLGTNSRDGFITEYIESLISAQKQINENITTILATTRSKLDTEINKLRDEDLVQLKREDLIAHKEVK